MSWEQEEDQWSGEWCKCWYCEFLFGPVAEPRRFCNEACRLAHQLDEALLLPADVLLQITQSEATGQPHQSPGYSLVHP